MPFDFDVAFRLTPNGTVVLEDAAFAFPSNSEGAGIGITDGYSGSGWGHYKSLCYPRCADFVTCNVTRTGRSGQTLMSRRCTLGAV